MENWIWTSECEVKQPQGLVKFSYICNWCNTYDDWEKTQNRYACKHGDEDSIRNKTERNRQIARLRRGNYERDTH